VALNTAYSEQGTFIYVADHQVVEKPVLLYFFSDTTESKVIAHPRNLFLIGKNSQATFVEYFHTIGEQASYNNAVTEIVLEDHAVAAYYKIETESENALHTGTTQVNQSASSLFSATTIALSGGVIRNNLNIALDAEGCEAHMFGLTLLKNQDHVDNHTVADHRKPNSFSNELYKNILDDRSTGVFNGKIFVRPNAQKTNAFQSNMNVLLTDNAVINTKPQLEIWADDVKCSHGATTGQIDQEQMFYLRSRGLSEETARAMLLYAFAIDVLENIKIPALREQLDQMISDRLHKNF
jgi:Fe-S cluster assembly protein SufD